MGNKPSQEDQQRLLEDYEIEPIFEELKLVLIGIQGAGKNTIGNAIFRKKVFTFWTSYKSDSNKKSLKETHKVSGTQIHLARTPGWKGELSRSEKTRREIVHCVQSLYDTGPHAVLLALKVNSKLPESTISTLESLLTDELWNHTIVIFTHGEKLGHCNIKDYIRSTQLQSLIEKCGQRYFDIRKNDGKQITDTIEELIIRKNSGRAICFNLSDQREPDEHEGDKLSNWKGLVERTKSKIASILRFKEKLLSKQNKDKIEIRKLLNSKDEEIRRLETVVEEKEREIERLQSVRTQDPDPIVHRRVAELEEKLDLQYRELMEKDTKIETLEKKVKERDTENEELTNEIEILRHVSCCSKLSQDVTTMNSRRDTEIQLHDIPSNGSALRNWSQTLLKILNELSDDDLKIMKYELKNNEEYRIPVSLIERTDNRVDLADSMLKQWGKRQSVLNIRDLMKKIPHNKDVMMNLFTPVLEEIGETW
ncbi:hypothetical protein R3I93_001114 [Phoxinus phoxinus]|uniref:AIG1-type G domain-containing protein n=1 Tax=Phoxinus phoxinus TaxID=58324 RepID=A0AAN9DMS1_9TELE